MVLDGNPAGSGIRIPQNAGGSDQALADKFHQAAESLEETGIDLVVMELQAKLLLQSREHGEHAHRVELRQDTQQRSGGGEFGRLIVELECIAEDGAQVGGKIGGGGKIGIL